jgi:hypothetical protein
MPAQKFLLLNTQAIKLLARIIHFGCPSLNRWIKMIEKQKRPANH